MAQFYSPVLEVAPSDFLDKERKDDVDYILRRDGLTREKFVQRNLPVHKDVKSGGYVSLKVSELLQIRGNGKELCPRLQRVPDEYKNIPLLTIPNIIERIQKFGISIQKDRVTSDKDLQHEIVRIFCDLEFTDVLSEFTDEEIAMMHYYRVIMSTSPIFEQYLENKNRNLLLIRQHLWTGPGIKAYDNWNVVVDLLQKMESFQYAPFDVRIDGTPLGNKGPCIYGRKEGNQRIYVDAGLVFHFCLGDKRIVTLSFECTGEKAVRIRQIQGEKGVRKEISLMRKYPEDILKAFIECFEGYEVSLIEGEKAYYDVLGGYRDINLEDYDEGVREACTNIIGKDGPRIAKFYNQDFQSLEVGPVENGFRKMSLKAPQQETI